MAQTKKDQTHSERMYPVFSMRKALDYDSSFLLYDPKLYLRAVGLLQLMPYLLHYPRT